MEVNNYMANLTKKPMVSSIGLSYYGNDSQENKALSVKYLESSICLGVHRPLPQNQQQGNNKYDYKSGNEIYLTGKSAKTMTKIMKEAFKARIDGDKIKSRSIASGINLIEVCDGSKYGCEKGTICIAIFNDITENKTSNNYGVFCFKEDKIFEDYDRNNGSYNSIPVDGDIEYFIDQLNEFAKFSSNAAGHCIKKEQKFDMDRMITRQIQIMEALGIKVETLNTSRLNWNNNNSSKPSGSAITTDNTSDLLKELDEID
jgi:hypothetical protein